jgi:uncharacterized cupredoxin-like copper-binding protein
MPARPLLVVGLVLPLLLAGCGSDSSSASAAKATVKAGDSTCELSKDEFAAGSVEFEVENTGKDTTEVYVYGKGAGGDFDKVVGEVENVAPGTSRDFTVKVGGGTYEVACKPGQKGDGIRKTITVTGAAPTGTVEAAYDREVEVQATDFAFVGFDGFTAEVGERIEFKLENKSTSNQHELEILDAAGNNLGEVGPTDPGKNGETVIQFTKPGTYTYKCGIADHAGKGMQGTFVVR